MRRKIVLIVVAVVAILLLAVGVIGYGFMNEPRIKAAQSIAKIDDGLYTLTYEGDYGFDEFLARGGAATDAEMAQYITEFLTSGFGSAPTPDTTASYGCSTFVSRTSRGVLFGRNFDFPFQTGSKAMIVHARPSHGYASISTACLDFMGMPAEWCPDSDMMSRVSALAALYLPLDGINEKGLCVADLVAGDEEEIHQMTDNSDLTITATIRLLLDKAASVEEAIELLRQYDIHSSIGTSHHIAIADSEGTSVVVEYIDGEMSVVSTNVVTNHYLTPGEKFGLGNELSHQRYGCITDACDRLQERMSITTAHNILREASYPEYTQWSIVYATDACEAYYTWRSHFDKEPYVFAVSKR